MYGVKVTLTMTPYPDLAATPRDLRVSSSLTLPEDAKRREDLREQILAIAEHAAYFTQFSLFVSCKEAGLRDHPVSQKPEVNRWLAMRAIMFAFTHVFTYSQHTKHVKLHLPAPAEFPLYVKKQDKPLLLSSLESSLKDQPYLIRIRAFIDGVTNLLSGEHHRAYFEGVHPNYLQTRMIKRLNQHGKKQKRERQQTRVTSTPPSETSTLPHGAGRTIGARPGVYQGVQMRSQLEIRFASELDERGIRWVYEGEAIGPSQYLIDFYLPDLGVWVEVKGKLSARDRQGLPEVAQTLKNDRGEVVYLYTQDKCYRVNPSGLREIEQASFWQALRKR
ncbi:MAG: hypothetical protein MUF87_18910 [Anaerolineae bacterium]|nr:hypothetical protein [Anaerolineae bacterium]